MANVHWGIALVLAAWACTPDAETTTSNGGGGAQSSVGGGGAGGATGGSGGDGGLGGAGGGGGAGLPLDGFGVLTGDCGEIDPAELIAMSPGFEISNAIEFPAEMYSRADLSPGGQALFDEPNMNPGSKNSELFAYEVLFRCELAELLKTEKEIDYETQGVVTDFLVEIDGEKVGVSVVRAFKFMDEYTVADALEKMEEKLADILESTENVAPSDAWGKQILSVVAEKPENAQAVLDALPQIDAAIRSDTIIVITTTNGDDAFIF